MSATKNPFNTPLEAGVRSVVILTTAFPATLDLQRLVVFDYLVVHSADANGPSSLHPPVPLRSGELLVRRHLIERGLFLMMSKKLVAREFSSNGVCYSATDEAAPFVSELTTPYSEELKLRCTWAIQTFGSLSTDEINARTSTLIKKWNAQFEGEHAPGLLL